MITVTRDSLRKSLRDKRNALSPRQQRAAASALVLHCRRWPPFVQAQRIGFYWPMRGEISPDSLLQLALAMGKECWFPVIRRFPAGVLGFARYTAEERLHRHHWGFLEPRGRHPRRVDELDLLFMPLTGFDRQGNRLGMGGGFYDRTLAHSRRKPLKAGLAHDCQQVESLPVSAWDVPLDVVLTPRRLWRFGNRRQA